MELDVATAQKTLESLGFDCQRTSEDSLSVAVPYWRNDVSIAEDLVEEVVRIIGYDAVPTTMLATPIPYAQARPMTGLVARVKDLLAGAGMQEVINYPLISLEDLRRVTRRDDVPAPLRLSNPMNAEQGFLRPTLRASLLSTLALNQGHGEGPFRLFEAGRVFHPRDGDLRKNGETAAGVLAGRRWDASWLTDDGLLDFYDAKGVVETALERLGLAAVCEPADDPTFAPGRCARVLSGGAVLGVIGELHPEVIAAFDLNAPKVSLWELDLEALLGALSGERREFQPLSPLPRGHPGPGPAGPRRRPGSPDRRNYLPKPPGVAGGTVRPLHRRKPAGRLQVPWPFTSISSPGSRP